jgi:replicative DNA helicase
MIQKLTKLNSLSDELEKKILSSVIANYREINVIELLSSLSEEDFLKYKNIYLCIKESFETKNNLQTILRDKNIKVSEFLEVYLDFDKKNIDELRRVNLTKKYLKQTSNAIEKANYRNIESTISEYIGDISSLSLFEAEKKNAAKCIDLIEKREKEFEEKLKQGIKTLGESTGFLKLDDNTEGFLPGSLNILGGYSGAGKTSLCVNIMKNLLLNKKRVVFYSLEMTGEEIATKLMALLANNNPIKMAKGLLTDQEFEEKELAKAKIYEMDFDIYDNISDFDKIKLSMIKESMTKPVDLFILDYLQLASSKKYSKQIDKMSSFPNELKTQVARKTGTPVLAISQVSNENANNKNSEIGGYKGSGDIEYASDLAMKLINIHDKEERDSRKQQKLPVFVDCSITKQRHGITGSIQMSFNGYTGEFFEGRNNN